MKKSVLSFGILSSLLLPSNLNASKYHLVNGYDLQDNADLKGANFKGAKRVHTIKMREKYNKAICVDGKPYSEIKNLNKCLGL